MEQLKEAIKKELSQINASVEACILELPSYTQPIAMHIFSAGGKRIRPLLTLWAGRLFGCTDDTLYTIGTSLEILHAATLLHDDIMDNADKRRGTPSAHTLFNPTQVILAGDAMLAKSLCLVAELGEATLAEKLSEAILRTAEGQIAELENVHNAYLTYEKYIEIITGKTAWILMVACEMASLYAGATKEQVQAMATFGLEIGIAFQLIDDALDFYPSHQTGKPCGGDLLEGKLTPPLFYYLASLEGKDQEAFIDKFTKSKFSEDEITTVIGVIQKKGFAERTRDMAKKHINNALSALSNLPDAPEKYLLESIAKYIIVRFS